ncbi:NH3-dependent NAD(+) synthetase [Vibrio chagasii]|nr:NH3-dependent NAD(+) synthetase [Vibrio chagasii]
MENMMNMTIKQEILKELGVKQMDAFDANEEIAKRTAFLANYLKTYGLKNLVLGISGGVDSSTAGKLAQLAVNQLRDSGYQCNFIAVRLPYGVQSDEDEAQNALKFINPDQVEVFNIKDATDSVLNENVAFIDSCNLNANQVDFAKGNVKARERMICQYFIANLTGGLVIGTDHSAEAVTGFYTLHGDGACDIMPLSGLNKRQVRLIAKELGAPVELYDKVATADLEDLKEQLTDEDALGVTYDEIDDYLEGKSVSPKAAEIIEHRYNTTRFKRRLPASYR